MEKPINPETSVQVGYVANRYAHKTNKTYYGRRTKQREFKAQKEVYLYISARRPGLPKKT